VNKFYIWGLILMEKYSFALLKVRSD